MYVEYYALLNLTQFSHKAMICLLNIWIMYQILQLYIFTESTLHYVHGTLQRVK